MADHEGLMGYLKGSELSRQGDRLSLSGSKQGTEFKEGDFVGKVKNEWMSSKSYNIQMHTTHRFPSDYTFFLIPSESKVDKR